MVADTSVEVYVKHDRFVTLANDVLQELGTFPEPPTAREVAMQMKEKGLVKYYTSVQPRLTELKLQGLVCKGEKRTCGISGNTAYTWKMA